MAKFCQHRLTHDRMGVQEAYFAEFYCVEWGQTLLEFDVDWV